MRYEKMTNKMMAPRLERIDATLGVTFIFYFIVTFTFSFVFLLV